ISSRLGTDSPEKLRSMLSERMNQMEDLIHEKQRQQEMKRWELERLKKASSQPSGSSDNVLAVTALDRDRLDFELSMLQKDLERQRVRVAEAGDIAQEIASYDERIRQKREL